MQHNVCVKTINLICNELYFYFCSVIDVNAWWLIQSEKLDVNFIFYSISYT